MTTAVLCAALAGSDALQAAAHKGGKNRDSTSTTEPATTATNPTHAKATRGSEIDRIAAVVNDGVVLRSELDAQVLEFSQRLRAQNVALPADKVLRDQVLERLVLEEIQAQRARRAGINISDEQVNEALQRMAKAQNVPFAQLPEKMAEAGYVYADFRDGVRRQMAREILQDNDVIEKTTCRTFWWQLRRTRTRPRPRRPARRSTTLRRALPGVRPSVSWR
jgi:peptidyl-prolyl cis-trans isomerase SurA